MQLVVWSNLQNLQWRDIHELWVPLELKLLRLLGRHVLGVWRKQLHQLPGGQLLPIHVDVILLRLPCWHLHVMDTGN